MCSINWMMVLAGHTKLLRIKIFVAPTWNMVLAEKEIFSRFFFVRLSPHWIRNLLHQLNDGFGREEHILQDICCTYLKDGPWQSMKCFQECIVRLSPHWIRNLLHQLKDGFGRKWKGNEMTRSSRYFCHLPQSPLTAIIWDTFLTI